MKKHGGVVGQRRSYKNGDRVYYRFWYPAFFSTHFYCKVSVNRFFSDDGRGPFSILVDFSGKQWSKKKLSKIATFGRLLRQRSVVALLTTRSSKPSTE